MVIVPCGPGIKERSHILGFLYILYTHQISPRVLSSRFAEPIAPNVRYCHRAARHVSRPNHFGLSAPAPGQNRFGILPLGASSCRILTMIPDDQAEVKYVRRRSHDETKSHPCQTKRRSTSWGNTARRSGWAKSPLPRVPGGRHPPPVLSPDSASTTPFVPPVPSPRREQRLAQTGLALETCGS